VHSPKLGLWCRYTAIVRKSAVIAAKYACFTAICQRRSAVKYLLDRFMFAVL
jgi:hypothetical protein